MADCSAAPPARSLVGVNRVRVAPGKLPTPPHSHGASEELFYVLAGSGSCLAGRRRARDAARATASSIAPTTSSTRSSPGRRASSTLSSGRATRPRSAGCPAPARSASAGRGSKAATTIRGTSRRRLGPLELGDPQPRPENIRNVDEVEPESVAAPDLGRRSRTARTPTSRGWPGSGLHAGPDRLRPALPLRGGGDLRDPRGLGDPAPLARIRAPR